MSPVEPIHRGLATLVPLSPLLCCLILGLVMLLHRAPAERTVARWVLGSLGVSLGCALATTLLWLSRPDAVLTVECFSVMGGLDVFLRIDALSATMMLLTSLLSLLIARFSVTYLHREPGFARFFLLLALAASGMQWMTLGGSLELLFVGWEWVGLTSALLIGFFHERATPVSAGLRAFGTYRLCDLGLLGGLVLMHHLLGTTAWSGSLKHLGAWPATAVSLGLLLAAMGKSAQLPFSGWLPRAMEGPTPSSALFYGALSVHAGPYLLLRAAPLLERAPWARGVMVLVGLLTAVQATLVWRVQTDVKGALAQSVLTQVGLMFAEVGLGLHTLALVHLVAHACLRCHQFLRAPSALRDAKARHAALRAAPVPCVAWLQHGLSTRLHRLAMERFALDELCERWAIKPVLRLGHWLDAGERRWEATLDAEPAPNRSEEPSPDTSSTGAT
ncbi:proton-conducting transporter membrane subunit [Myxococcus fulvus]|uniref:proton-conducting transporter transmembrane domain-containing protein n=1 Tax=Myxococcus fulvus TaxID=33 RepID=UPI003B9C47E7